MFACKCRVHQTVGVRSSNSPNSEQQKFKILTISPNNLNNPNNEQTEQLVSSEQFLWREQAEQPDLALNDHQRFEWVSLTLEPYQNKSISRDRTVLMTSDQV